jgi:biopolymer transport protein ExbD
MEFKRAKPPKNTQPDLIPLINIVFLLLIFFLVAGTLRKPDAVSVNTPDSRTGLALDRGQLLIILGPSGEVLLNDRPINEKNLEKHLRARLLKDPKQMVMLKADASLPAEKLNKVIQAAARSGVLNLAIMTEPY